MTLTGGFGGGIEEGKQVMGIDWSVLKRELVQAIPPAYTEYLGRQLMTAVGSVPRTE